MKCSVGSWGKGYTEGPGEGQLEMRLKMRMETGDSSQAKAFGHHCTGSGEPLQAFKWGNNTIRCTLGSSFWQEADGLWDWTGGREASMRLLSWPRSGRMKAVRRNDVGMTEEDGLEKPHLSTL